MDIALTGFLHPLHGADHLIAMIAVGIWAVQFGGSRGWLVPVAFTTAMPVGATLGVANLDGFLASTVEIGVAVSTIVLAVSCLTRPERWRVLSVVGLAGLLHGFVHGTESGAMTLSAALPFFAGMMVATLMLHVTGAAIGRMLRAKWLSLRLAPPLFSGTMLVPQAVVAQNALEAEPGTAEVIGNRKGPGGFVIEGSAAAVLQQLNGGGSGSGKRESRANYRGDVTAALPAPGVGHGEGLLFGHVRFGQGAGVTTRPTYTGSVNSLAFETSAGPDDSFAILAQLYYHLTVLLAPDTGEGKKRFELNVGKMDPFVFFDQNEVADDESRGFLNNVFVHNPLLDSGGGLGADKYGFTPGVRAAYFNDESARFGWGASVGVFGAGPGASFSGSLSKPFLIAQLEVSPKRFDGEAAGTYRLYGWGNAQADDFDGTRDKHSGWGLSLDQRAGEDWNFFARFGQRTVGRGAFDRAITIGFELSGNRWGRSSDGIGMAIGNLSTDDSYRAASADGTIIGYPASGSEKIGEVFYRYALNQAIELSPHFKMVQRPGGDSTAPTLRAFGVRAKISF